MLPPSPATYEHCSPIGHVCATTSHAPATHAGAVVPVAALSTFMQVLPAAHPPVVSEHSAEDPPSPASAPPSAVPPSEETPPSVPPSFIGGLSLQAATKAATKAATRRSARGARI